MDSDRNSVKIPKLRDYNFHFWKFSVKLVLSVKDFIDQIHNDSPSVDSSDFRTWSKNDFKALETISM